MHALVVTVTIQDLESDTRLLEEQIVPRVSQAPGFVAGYWTRKDNAGLSMIVFESEDAAKAASERIRSPDASAATVDSVDVREVVAQA